jgi:Flp pilus assembly protein TadG
VLIVLLLVPLFGLVAFGVDLGVVTAAKADLQRTADAAALSAAWELYNAQSPSNRLTASGIVQEARDAAIEYAGLNSVLAQQHTTLANADIELGYAADPLGSQVVRFNNPYYNNIVRVTVRRDQQVNSPVPAFFARVLGHDSTNVTATATAAFVNSVRGFQAPLDPRQKIPLLPFALDQETWNNARLGRGDDDLRWDDQRQRFEEGCDGIPEFNLYPQDTGSTANRGTVNIGTSNNATSHVARLIVEGVSAADLAHHGGQLVLDHNGQLALGGDPGISAGFKSELASICGEPRIVPIFSNTAGNGNNTSYTIVGWAGLRLAEVRLTGGNKRVIAQACRVQSPGIVPGGNPDNSPFISSTVWLAK